MKAKEFFDRLAMEDEGFREELELARSALDLARNVHGFRRALGWSQAELAKAVGTSQPRIAELEGGAGNPTLRTLSKLANALHCEVSALLGSEDVWAARDWAEFPAREVSVCRPFEAGVLQIAVEEADYGYAKQVEERFIIDRYPADSGYALIHTSVPAYPSPLLVSSYLEEDRSRRRGRGKVA